MITFGGLLGDATEDRISVIEALIGGMLVGVAYGLFSGQPISPDGELISQEEWDARTDEWLPTKADGDFIQSLMVPCFEPGKYAGWIAPPKVGIDNKPGDFEYVKLHMA